MAKIFGRRTMLKSVVFIVILLNSCVCGYDSWTEYWEAYEMTSYFPRLYPYKQEFHDVMHSDVGGFDAEINFQIPFFGRYYKGAYVATEGFVKLSKEMPSTNTPHYPNTKLPNPNFPDQEDAPMIAPYYSSWELLAADPGRIFWRKLDPDEETDEGQRDIVEGMLEVLSQEVRRHVVGGDQFHAEKGLIVTWDMMQFYGCVPDPTCPTNTVQMALLTEEFGTFVIYNYYNVSWSGGSKDYCDPQTGMKGESPYDKCFPAQAGFNEGEGRHFLHLPHSNTEDVVDLDIKGATGVQGRYIYDVTHPTMVRGGCTNDTDTEFSSWELEVYPLAWSLFGGTTVYFSGPCLMPSQNIRCRFGTEVVYGRALPDTQSKGMCVSPRMHAAGWTDFCVSTNGGTDYNHCTRIHITPKYYHWTKVHLHNENAEWYRREHGDLTFDWNPHDLTYFHEGYCGGVDMGMCNDTDPIDMTVDISLIGYKENINMNGTLQGSWLDLHTFSTDIPNSGEFTFHTSDHECTVDCGWERPHIGVIKISVHDEPEQYIRSIYSEPVPLGWYQNSVLTSQLGGDWPELMCNDWATAETDEWKEGLVPCPLTKSHAYTDIGGFIYPNPDCDPGQPCPMKPRPEPHIECAESVVPTMSKYGSASSCCYSSDGHLLYGLDTSQGSTLSRASPYTSRDSYSVKVTPWLSHWSRDRFPYVMCCHWSSVDVCQERYMSHRKPVTDTPYRPVKYGAGYGDPHFTTYDGNEYMFNGHGEFWLLQIDNMEEQYDNFIVQVRLQQPQPQYGYPVNASVITAIVMQEGWSLDQEVSRVQLEVNDMDASSKINFYVNGALKEFGTPDLMYQELYSLNGRRMIVQNNDPPHSNHQSNFTLIFENGIAVQVANRNGFLQMVVVLPEKYYRMTSGLLGTWNNDPTDDLRTPMGAVIPATDPPETIHKDFGQMWEVIQGTGDSLFIYRGNADWDHFRDPNFVPNFVEPEGPSHNITDEDVKEVCGDNFICSFDYKTTMSKDVANATLYLQLWVNEVRTFTDEVLSCPYLDIEHSQRTVDKYTVGGHLKLTGCSEDYTLQGETDYQCVEVNDQEAQWDPAPDTECKSNAEIEKEQALLVTAIVVPIVMIIILAVLAAGGFIYYRKRQKQPQSDGAAEIPKKTKKTPTDRDHQFTDMALSASTSQSLASINNSFGSIVLTEQLQTARPARPQSMQTGLPHPMAGHAQLSVATPYTPANTGRKGSYDQSAYGQGISLSPDAQPQGSHQVNRSLDMNNPRMNQSADHQSNRSFDQYGGHQNSRVNQSLDLQNGRPNQSFYQQHGRPNQSFDQQNGHPNQSFDHRNGRPNQSFDQQNGRVNQSFDHQNGAMSSRAASQTSLSRLPPANASAKGVPNPALAAEESDYSDSQEDGMNSSRTGQAVYTMNGFGEDTVV